LRILYKTKLLTKSYKSSIFLNRTLSHEGTFMLAAALNAVRRFFGSDDAETPEARKKRLAGQRELGENAYIRIREATNQNPFHNPLTCAIGIGTVGPLQAYGSR